MVLTPLRRLLMAGGFTIATAAAPALLALSAPAATSWQGDTDCPPGTTENAVSGSCFQVGAQQNSAPDAPPPPGPGGPFGSIDGIPCTGSNTGECMGLAENAPVEVHPHPSFSSSP